jgi:hypothetical protein
MAWEDVLTDLRGELAEVREQRQQRAARERAQLDEARGELELLAGSLGVEELLSSMNSILLDDQGRVEAVRSWEVESDDDEFPEINFPDIDIDEEDEEGEMLSHVLSWDEEGDREIAVEMVLTGEGISLLVNGIGVRPERAALEDALVEAFRDELEL